ncbi:unnamed protein product [Adineta steineri]|uniref:Potassium channel domain-containing protein n=1 Tax=Adineta steineri TaxID=433720 RepID=A0A818RIX9_9BILA|nr:unnamed protein product [Adineta steineri]
MIIGTQNVRTVALMFIVLIYLMLGAAVFNALESKREIANRLIYKQKIARILYRTDTVPNETLFVSLTTAIFENRHFRRGTAKQWTFPGAFYFSTLVVTLIGYGQTTPKTMGGKIFCMVYTVAGVPLNLIMFQSVGERLNAIISFVLSRLKRFLGLRRQKVSGFELIAVEFGMTTMLVLCGSIVFSTYEEWTYFESIYYSLVTFWTIGFGDMVPLASLQRSGHSLYSRWGYFIFTMSFILFGLALVASSLNLLVLRLAQFHSENGIGGISALLGRNEEELIAAAIAEHRASICPQQRNRICSNTNSLNQSHKALSPFLSLKTNSRWSLSSSSSTSSDKKSDFIVNSHDKTCCSAFSCLNRGKRKRRYWHLRRSPQNIKHLLYFNQLLDNNKLQFVRKSLISNQYHQHHHHHHQITNHVPRINSQMQHRISI